MKEHISEIDIVRYRRQNMPMEKIISVSDHLVNCVACYKRFEDTKQLDLVYNLVRSMFEPARGDITIRDTSFVADHLSYDLIEAYVDGDLDSQGCLAVENHIQICQECEADVRELLELNLQLDLQIEKGANRSIESAAEKTQRAHESLPRFWPGVAAFWQLPAYRASFVATVALVIIGGAVGWISVLSQRTQFKSLRSQLHQLEEAKEIKTQLIKLRDGNTNPITANDAKIIMTLNDGNGQITIDESKNIKGFAALPTDYARLTQIALTTEQINVEPMPTVSPARVGRLGTLRSDQLEKRSFGLISPVGKVIRSIQPILRWRALSTPLPGVMTYSVFLKDVTAGVELEGQFLKTTEWTPKQPLVQGHLYAWIVEATQDKRRNRGFRAPLPSTVFASFIVLDKAQDDELKRLQAERNTSHLLLGIACAKAGLRDETEREFRVLQAANPDSRIAGKWTQSLESQRQ